MRKNLIRALSTSKRSSSHHVSREVQSSSSDESRNFRMFKWTAISSGLAAFYYLHERSKTEALCKFYTVLRPVSKLVHSQGRSNFHGRWSQQAQQLRKPLGKLQRQSLWRHRIRASTSWRRQEPPPRRGQRSRALLGPLPATQRRSCSRNSSALLYRKARSKICQKVIFKIWQKYCIQVFLKCLSRLNNYFQQWARKTSCHED